MKKKLVATLLGLTVVATSLISYGLGIENGIDKGTSDGIELGVKQGYREGYGQGYAEGKAYSLDGYIKLTDCVPLEDICAKYTDEYDYINLIIGDYGKQLDNPDNASYETVLKDIPDETQEYKDNMVNMSEVVNYVTTETGLYLHLENGDYYYWGR